jgi:uncharacterized membrane protein YesL
MGNQFASLKDGLKRSLTIAADMIILNLLFILCSIPVITMGAAAAASYSSILRVLRGDPAGISIPGFFRDFAAAFKKATLCWLAELGCIALIAGDLWFAIVYSEPDNIFFLIFASVLAVGTLLAAVWLYPLIARFENKLGAYIKNSFLMMFARLPKTLLALLIQAAFVAVPLLFFDAFAFFGWFWLLFGASLPMYMTAKILRKNLLCEPEKVNTDEQREIEASDDN